jgi:uncharacterized membrane protein YciS (DUF1049 family)
VAFVKFFNWALLLVVLAVCVMIAVANHQTVVFNLDPLPFEAKVPLFLVVFASFLMGLLVGWLFLIFHRLRSKCHLKKAERRIDALETQLRETTRDDVSTMPSDRNLYN